MRVRHGKLLRGKNEKRGGNQKAEMKEKEENAVKGEERKMSKGKN